MIAVRSPCRPDLSRWPKEDGYMDNAELGRHQLSMFKNNVLRYETPECKIIDVPVSLNEGRYRVDFG